jgi:putative hemolysin
MDFHKLIILLLIFVLIGLSAFFSGSETALMAASRLRLRYLSETRPQDRKRIEEVETILRDPERLIGTILLGNNLVNITMSALATALILPVYGEEGILYVMVVLTLVILIFAEITPKVYAKHFSESVSIATAPAIRLVMRISLPAVSFVTFVSRGILRLAGLETTKRKRALFTEAVLQTCIKMAWDDGGITTEERKLLSRVFTLNDKSAADVMVPAHRMTVLPRDSTLEDIVRTVIRTGFSRFPVTKGKGLDIIGIVHSKDILRYTGSSRHFSMDKILRAPVFIPASRKIDVQLRLFQTWKIHQAIVLDDEGKVAGLVTLEDIVEELVGAIEDEHDPSAAAETTGGEGGAAPP